MTDKTSSASTRSPTNATKKPVSTAVRIAAGKTSGKPLTRIQKRNRQTILEAALEVFSAQGFRGATLDQIATEAGLSKPNLLYYYPSKEAIHVELLSGLLDIWLAPLHEMSAEGDPKSEIMTYMRRKLEMSRELPRESRLFANEVLQGAPRFHDGLAGQLKTLVDEKAAIIQRWIDQGRLAPLDPYHLIFSIWSLTQHYADFDVQVRTILEQKRDPFAEAEVFLDFLFHRLLSVDPCADAERDAKPKAP